jgi:DNA-binding XRE family transcriptional regulator
MSAAEFKAWRERLGLSQRGAAARLGLSKRTIIRYEKGTHRVNRHVALSCAIAESMVKPHPKAARAALQPVEE